MTEIEREALEVICHCYNKKTLAAAKKLPNFNLKELSEIVFNGDGRVVSIKASEQDLVDLCNRETDFALSPDQWFKHTD